MSDGTRKFAPNAKRNPVKEGYFMLDILEPYVITFVVLYGIGQAALIAAALGLSALLFVFLDTLLSCAMGD